MAATQRMDIERLVTWALLEQGLGFIGRVGASADAFDLGTRVDTSPRGSVASPSVALFTDPDAMVLRQALDGLQPLAPEAVTLLVQYGRAGIRPDWEPEGYGLPTQLTTKNGQPMWIYAKPGNYRSARVPAYDWPAYGRHVENVRFHRAAWSLWWQGLAELVPIVNAGLATHEATGPAAPAEPWAGQDGPIDYRGPGSIEELRRLANEPVRSIATDWSEPPRPRKRRSRGTEKAAAKAASAQAARSVDAAGKN